MHDGLQRNKERDTDQDGREEDTPNSSKTYFHVLMVNDQRTISVFPKAQRLENANDLHLHKLWETAKPSFLTQAY